MPNLQEQIKRDGHLLDRPTPKQGKRGAARVRVKPVSDKRQRANREYLKRRAVFLATHPFCQAFFKIRAFENPNNPPTTSWPFSSEIHHTKRPKCKYLNDESTWLAVCRWSHDWIHAHPKDARALKLLA